MKIVRASNYDDELYEEKFVENIPLLPNGKEYKEVYKLFCDMLNAIDPSGPHYYKAVDDDYRLKTGDPNDPDAKTK